MVAMKTKLGRPPEVENPRKITLYVSSRDLDYLGQLARAESVSRSRIMAGILREHRENEIAKAKLAAADPMDSATRNRLARSFALVLSGGGVADLEQTLDEIKSSAKNAKHSK